MKATQGLFRTVVILVALIGILNLTTNSSAQTRQGRAEVRSVKGQALYSINGGPAMQLKVGTILNPGTTIETAVGSTVDLFLGNSAGVVRVTESSTVSLDKLTITDTGADTVVEVQMNLPEGTILGNANKLSAASKYEIKIPNGVAGIRGTRYRIGSNAFIVLLDGTLVFVHIPPGGNPTPYTLTGPPAVYFSPLEGVKLAPDDLTKEVRGQFAGGPVAPPPGGVNAATFSEPFVSPGIGAK
jgi:hypothetical protein